MKNLIQKIDWNKFRIRNRKDWMIFWIFTVCICYAIGIYYADMPGRWLFHFANPYMTQLNQPHTWGQLMVFLPLFVAVTEVVLFLCKKPVKAKILLLAGALLMPMVIVAGYRIHTNLIVSSLWKEDPGRVMIFWKDADSEKQENRRELAGEERKELLELCRGMIPVSDQNTLEMLKQWYQEYDREQYAGRSHIRISFAEKYGHSYELWLYVYDGKVYLWRGYSSSMEEITFFEDNGIVEWMEEITVSGISETIQNAE